MKKSYLYLKEFNWKSFLNFFSVVAIICLTREYIYRGISKFVISPFGINEIKQSLDLDILSILLLSGFLARIVYLIFWKKLKPCINSIVNVLLSILCYFIVIRFSNVYKLEPIGFFPAMKYLDILFLAFLFSLTKFKYFGSPAQYDLISGFIEDDFDINESIDILDRKGFAWQVGTKILDTKPPKKAFVIAINSPWGFGKSGFLLMLEDVFKKRTTVEFQIEWGQNSYGAIDVLKSIELDRRRADTVIMKYNPWKNFDEKKIIQDFFDELSNSLSDHDSQLSRNIKKYSNYLYKLNDSTLRKIIEVSIDSSLDEPTLSAQFEVINKAIGQINKRIIVFIDDLDRLTGDELIDILKLIRNTANFRNIFFVVAYDHNYVLNTIDKKGLISSKEEYLHKIVQLEISLPAFNKNLLIKFLEEQLKGYRTVGTYLDITKMKSAFNEISDIEVVDTHKIVTFNESSNELVDYLFKSDVRDNSLLFSVFRNIRDVVRFINSFKVSFELIGELGDLYEIILLDILKVKYISIYQMVLNRRLLHLVDQKYEFDFDEFDTFLTPETAKAINIKSGDIAVVRMLLKSIFSPKRKIYFRSIKYPKYFNIYFAFRTPNLIELARFEYALKSYNIDDIKREVDQAVLDKTYVDLRNFLDSQTEFGNKEDYEIILRALFYISKHDNQTKYDTLFQIRTILRDRGILEKFYEQDKNSFSLFLLSILEDKKYNLHARAEIAWDELYKILNKSNEEERTSILINDKSKLQKILLNCFEDITRRADEIDSEIFDYYLKNLENIEPETRRIIITDDANTVMRKFIVAHSYDYFKKYFLREHPEPSFKGQYFYLDPFVLNYFNNNWDQVYSDLISIKAEFLKNEEEKKFYELLLESLELAKNRHNEKFLIEDKEKINIAEKFIAIVQRTKKIN